MSPTPENGRRLASRDAGFTLFEVLVALAVLGVAVAVFAPVISISTQRAHQAADRLAIITAGYSLLESLPGRSDLRAEVTEGALGAVRWRMATTAIASDEAPAGKPGWRAYRLILDLTGPHGARTRVETVRLGRNGGD